MMTGVSAYSNGKIINNSTRGVLDITTRRPLTQIGIGGGWQGFNWFGSGVVWSIDNPFTYQSLGRTHVMVTDAFLTGDQFKIFDGSTMLGVTSPPSQMGYDVWDPNPDSTYNSNYFSHGCFDLQPGSHAINIQVIQNPWEYGTGYIKAEGGSCDGTPSASFIYSPENVNPKQKINFDASSSGPQQNIVKYSWEFGDVKVETEKPQTDYSFPDCTKYIVKLTVKDYLGKSDTLSRQINTNCSLCRVDVRAHRVDIVGHSTPFWHLFIIYVDPTGKEFFYRGGPSGTCHLECRPSFTRLPCQIVGCGNIATSFGEYREGTVDWTQGAPTVTALSGPRAFNKDTCFASYCQRIANLRVPYQILGPNSNTVARTLLIRCGVVPLKPVLITPGWDSPPLL